MSNKHQLKRGRGRGFDEGPRKEVKGLLTFLTLPLNRNHPNGCRDLSTLRASTHKCFPNILLGESIRHLTLGIWHNAIPNFNR